MLMVTTAKARLARNGVDKGRVYNSLWFPKSQNHPFTTSKYLVYYSFYPYLSFSSFRPPFPSPNPTTSTKMKTFSILAAGSSFLPFTSALVGWTWSVENTPDDGLKDITFPMNIANTQHESGYYFAQQFNFVNINDVGYAGLQPREDNSNGSSIIHAAFSSFQAGTTSDDSNCSDGADGGPGVSCAVEFPGSYAHTYNVYVQNDEGTTWSGTVVDTVTSRKIHIGTYTLPSAAKGIKGSQLGFIEDYAGHDPADLPYTNVTVGVPSTSTEGATGKMDEPYEYGETEGKVDFDFVKLANGGYQMSCGFK